LKSGLTSSPKEQLDAAHSKSVKELVRKIEEYIRQYNRHQKPFVWTAAADSILEKTKLLSQAATGSRAPPYFSGG